MSRNNNKTQNKRQLAGSKLKLLCARAHVKPKMLAKKIGKSVSAISQIESGATIPSSKTLLAILDCCNATPDDIHNIITSYVLAVSEREALTARGMSVTTVAARHFYSAYLTVKKENESLKAEIAALKGNR